MAPDQSFDEAIRMPFGICVATPRKLQGRNHEGHERLGWIFIRSPLGCISFDSINRIPLVLFVGMARMISHSLKSPSCVSKDVEAQLFFSKGEEIEGKGGSVDGVITVMAMTVASFSFLAMLCVPMGLEREMGNAAAEAAMESFQFGVFVIMNAATFFSCMGVVALLLQSTRSEDGIFMAVLCRRVTYIAMVCQGLAFLAAALTFARHP